jgi:hypothetical protein
MDGGDLLLILAIKKDHCWLNESEAVQQGIVREVGIDKRSNGTNFGNGQP